MQCNSSSNSGNGMSGNSSDSESGSNHGSDNHGTTGRDSSISNTQFRNSSSKTVVAVSIMEVMTVITTVVSSDGTWDSNGFGRHGSDS